MKRLKLLAKQPIWLISFCLMLILSVYWAFIASDRYVAKAHVVLQTSEIAPPELSFSSMLSGNASSNTSDLLLLREYLMSVDMLKILDQQLNLRQHFSRSDIDYFSRLSAADVTIETFHEYYLSRINIYLDDYSGVLRIEASAFDKQMALDIVTLLLQQGEYKMNTMGQELAAEQVAFIEKQVVELNQRLQQAERAVLNYQNEKGMISPTGEVESLTAVIASLNQQLSRLETERNALRNTLQSSSPQMRSLSSKIRALRQQIAVERKKLTASQGDTALNQVTADFESLKLRAEFARELYANALATLEATRVEAARKLKQLAVLQQPVLPEYALLPDRSYNVAVTIIFILILTLIINMILMIVKDHRD